MNPHQWPVRHDGRDPRNHPVRWNQWSPRDYREFGQQPGAGQGGFPAEFGYIPPQFGQNLPSVQSSTPLFGGGGSGGGGGGSGGGGLLGNFNLKDIKSVVDRLGGIDGIMSTVGKVQKIVSNIQQMQPMIKLLMTMLPGKSKSGGDDADNDKWKRPRKRRRRRRKGKKKAHTRSTIYIHNTQRARRRNPYY